MTAEPGETGSSPVEIAATAADATATDRYAAVFTAAPFDLVVIAVGHDGRFVYEDMNPTHWRNTGLTIAALVGRTPDEVFGPVAGAFAAARFRECVESGAQVEYEVTTRMPIGEVVRRSVLVPMRDETGRIAKILLTSIDLTETRRIEAQLRRAQRLEAIGQLTGGIAHDFNNLLTAILGNIELVETRVTDERCLARLAAAREAARRGGQLTHQLLAYARHQPLPIRAVEPGTLLHGMTDLLHRSLGGLVQVELRAGDDVWHARTDAAQLELAVLNLAINARDAMPEGGSLIIEARNLPHGSPDLPQDLPPGDYVGISVADTGTGMPPDVLERAFDPFFTTKEVGKGTGLGLAQVDGLARRSGGMTQLRSAPGNGTTVTILLPRATTLEPAVEPEAIVAADAPVISVTVLVVDDDAAVRSVAAAMLEQAGYEVREADGGAAGLAALEREVVSVALVDFAMPEMSGPEFIRLARRRWPGLQVAYLTGYSDPVRPASPDSYAKVLNKPYTRAALLAIVADLARGVVN